MIRRAASILSLYPIPNVISTPTVPCPEMLVIVFPVTLLLAMMILLLSRVLRTVLNAVIDQDSAFVKVTISVNDSKVLYYELDRQDLTIHERE